MKTFGTAILLTASVIFLSGCGAPKNVVINVQAPLQVQKGKEFVITATIRNTDSKAQKLVSLDIGDAYLKGVGIKKTVPEHSEAMHVPIDNTVSYTFDMPVQPGKEVQVLFYAEALKTGDYNSEIDFCINSETDYLSKTIRTVVE